jgi:glycine dehydrogenase
VLYTGRGGRVAHECIVDLRPISKATGVTVDDVAKRSSTTASTRRR